jgi:hypothetical protein
MLFQLKDQETIVTVYAEQAKGPGWSNQPLFVIVRDAKGRLREECLQPDEQTAEMKALFNVSATVHDQLVKALNNIAKSESMYQRIKLACPLHTDVVLYDNPYMFVDKTLTEETIVMSWCKLCKKMYTKGECQKL